MQVLRMARVIYVEWLRYVICNTWPLAILPSLNTVSVVQEQVIKQSILLAYFCDLGNEIFISVIYDLLFFSVCEPC